MIGLRFVRGFVEGGLGGWLYVVDELSMVKRFELLFIRHLLLGYKLINITASKIQFEEDYY